MGSAVYFEDNKNSFYERMDNVRKPNVSDRPKAVDKKDAKQKAVEASEASGNTITYRRSVRVKH